MAVFRVEKTSNYAARDAQFLKEKAALVQAQDAQS